MSYSIKAILHDRIDANGLQKIQIRVIHDKRKAYGKTDFKVSADQFRNGEIINHPLKTKMNALLRSKIGQIEERMIDFLKGENQSLERLKQVVSGESAIRIKLPDFIESYADEVQGKKSSSTIQVYRSIAKDLSNYDSSLYFDKIDIKWLHLFEQDQRKQWEVNTVNKKMKHVKAFLKRAEERGLIKAEQFKTYKVPVYEQKIPEYITEAEMDQIKKILDVVQQPNMKLSGMYFLLSCYAGYRLSDLKRFNSTFIKDDKIILKTKKNKSIVSIPIHARLKPIVDFCLSHPLTISEQNMRDYVHDIVKLAGINRRITIHTARHSFAMLLMDLGFDLEEVAELLGNTIKSAQIYARISNQRLSQKILDKLG